MSPPGPGLGADGAQKHGHAARDLGGNRSVSCPEAIVDDGIWTTGKKRLRTLQRGLPGGAVVKNLPANSGDTGASPGLGRSHMLWSN